MSIDRLRAHYGFTRMPFGKDLAPGMLHGHRAHQRGRRAHLVVPQRAGDRRHHRRVRRRQDRRRPRRRRQPGCLAAHRHLPRHPRRRPARHLHHHRLRAGRQPALSQRVVDPAGAGPARRRDRRARQTRGPHLRRSAPAGRRRAGRHPLPIERWHGPHRAVLLAAARPTDLRSQLRRGIFAALDQRIGLRYTITGLDQTETGSYIKHHLELAGRSDTLFSDDAVGLIHTVSRGLPRLINNLAVQSLIAAFAASKGIVDESSARAAVAEVADE